MEKNIDQQDSSTHEEKSKDLSFFIRPLKSPLDGIFLTCLAMTLAQLVLDLIFGENPFYDRGFCIFLGILLICIIIYAIKFLRKKSV